VAEYNVEWTERSMFVWLGNRPNNTYAVIQSDGSFEIRDSKTKKVCGKQVDLDVLARWSWIELGNSFTYAFGKTVCCPLTDIIASCPTDMIRNKYVEYASRL